MIMGKQFFLWRISTSFVMYAGAILKTAKCLVSNQTGGIVMTEAVNKEELLKILEKIYGELEEIDHVLMGIKKKKKMEVEEHLYQLTTLESAFSVLEEKLLEETKNIGKIDPKIKRSAALKLELN